MSSAWRSFVWLAAVWPALTALGQTANPAAYYQTAAPPQMVKVAQVETPDFQGMTLAEAQAANVIQAQASGGVQRPIFSQVKTTGPTDGVVDTQTPLKGTRVYPGREETLTLNMKAAMEYVPVLKGMTVAEAGTRLTQSDLKLGSVSGRTKVAAGDANVPRIASQTPLPGQSVPQYSAVDVVLEPPASTQGTSGASGATGGSGATGSSGASGVQDGGQRPPPPVEEKVPGVLTLSLQDATTALHAAKLGAPKVLGPANGVVVAQFPVEGTGVVEGTRIKLTMGITDHQIIYVNPPPATPWGWYIAGAALLLGAGAGIGAKIRQPPLPPVAATLVARPNPETRKTELTNSAGLRWTVQLRDQPGKGVTTVRGEIEGKRRGER